MGDPPVTEDEVVYTERGTRHWPSRLVERPARPTRLITVIAGPHEESCPTCRGNSSGPGSTCPGDHCAGGRRRHACVLYTAFGGPPAPQEPGDPGCKDPAESAAFWHDHALAR
jgi:hypothetical protein